MRGLLGRAISMGFIGALALVIGAGPSQTVEAGGGCRGVPSTEGSGDTVKMNESCFQPTVLHVAPGTAVSFENASTQPHTVSGATVEWGNYNELRNGESSTYTFDKTGTYPYYCFVHNGMTGAIVVGDGVGNGVSLPPVEKLVQEAASEKGMNAEPVASGAPSNVAQVAANDDSAETLLAGGVGALFGAVVVMAGFGVVSLRRR